MNRTQVNVFVNGELKILSMPMKLWDRVKQAMETTRLIEHQRTASRRFKLSKLRVRSVLR